ncbi:MAG: Glutamine--fructose-6-phosphate aminotransferase [isomerizing] [Legionellaceae bacterium]
MCGIMGAVAERDVTAILLEGLKRLEYRGYDSAGVAIIDNQGKIDRCRAPGKLENLRHTLENNPLHGTTGVAHTRWATHGIPNETNAHPLMSNNEIAVVHNGIIENYEKLYKQLTEAGYTFSSDTDTETVAHLIHYHLQIEKNFLKAVRAAVAELEGAYALAVISKSSPNQLIAVRKGSPLVIGLGIGEHFIASDHLALLPVVQSFIYLEEGDIAVIERETFEIFDSFHHKTKRNIHTSELSHDSIERGEYRHYMLKEIFEQPRAVSDTIEGRTSSDKLYTESFGAKAPELFKKIRRVQIVACGTSYHAGMVARYWLESIARIPCQVEVASEFRYRPFIVEPDTLFVTLSQSGETADTLAALRTAKTSGYVATLAICNVPESTLVRESDLILITRAGPEIGVASTKAFTTQLTALFMLTIALGKNGQIDAKRESELVHELNSIPKLIEQSLTLDNDIKKLAETFVNKHHTLFLGRGAQYPIALEGALKLKEISYIHAEAYPAGELKHGPLALVDDDMPVVIVAPNDSLLEKLKSNLQEVKARGGELIVFADESAMLKNGPNVRVISMPVNTNILAPLLFTIPLQLLSYHVAILKGTDIDQPRNLAKSVTVE